MIKVGIIGMGYWGNVLYNSLYNNENYQITKVCGRENNNYGDIFTNNHMDVMESDVDMVIISTQTKYHYDNIILSLEHGKDVIVEKPICLTKTEAEKVIKLSNENGLKLFVDHIYSTNPFILKIKEVINNDGSKLLNYKSFRYNENCNLYDTSIIENLMYHDFYILNYIFKNFDFYNLKPKINYRSFEYCDLQMGNIRFVSSYNDKKTRIIDIETENNKIYWDELDGTLIVNNEQIKVNTLIDNINHKFNDIYTHIKNGTDDNSKIISLNILKFIEKYEL